MNQPALQRKQSRELPSEGVALGAIQVPPSGQPVLFLADHPMTGGYPVIAVVLDADIDLAAQLRPGPAAPVRPSRPRPPDVPCHRSAHVARPSARTPHASDPPPISAATARTVT